MAIVLEAIYALTPIAKPSPYAKRWWTTDLTNLRRAYTYQRNQARAYRQRGAVFQDPIAKDLEQQASNAAKEYHNAIQRQKRAH